MSNKKENKLKLYTRRLSIKEGIFYSAKTSFGDQYIAPFSVLIGTSNSLITIINSIKNISLISQLLGGRLEEKYSRKLIFSIAIIAQSFGLLLLLISSIFYLKNMFIKELPYFVIIALIISFFSGGIGYPSWFSWIGDVVDKKFRGMWFSKRSTIISFTIIIFSILSALILNYSKIIGYVKIAFVILFLFAFIARISCIKIIKKQYEPERKRKKEKTYTLKEFLKELKNSNFGKFTIFRTMLSFARGMTVPLVSIYLLRNLGFDYLSFMAIMLSGTFFSILTLNIWGKISDKHGNYRVIAITTLFIPLSPLLLTLSTSKIYLFFVPAIIGGIAWNGFIMASSNFIYENISKEKIGNAISYFNLFIGTSALLGGFTSAFLLKIINFPSINPIIAIFLIGSVLRMAVIGFWVPKLKEITKKRKFKNINDLKNMIKKETKSTLIEDIHQITSIKGYIKEH